jgi:large subunit ribosomal protein L24
MSRTRKPVKKKKPYVRKRTKTAIKVEDTVKVISGKHKGSQGRVLEVDLEHGFVKLEDVAMQKRHLPPQRDPRFPEGGIIEQPGKIHLSNVMLVSEDLGRPVRTGATFTQDGKKQRVARGSGVKAVEV